MTTIAENNETNAPVIQTEITRLADFYNILNKTRAEQNHKLQVYDTEFKRLETLRREEHNFNKKEEITAEISVHDMTNPRKWIVPFTQDESPYFGIVGIHDKDKKIGIKEYVFGKQGLIGNDNKTHVIDWRNPVSVLYYDKYADGEEYEIEIKLKDRIVEREGIVTHTHMTTINKRNLLGIETRADTYKHINGAWITKDGTKISGPVSAEIKTDSGDHQLIDIVALISPEQFKAITTKDHESTLLIGIAGAGKTTVAEHQLSHLQYNYPELYNPSKCLFIVFNKELKKYVNGSSKELLENTPVETFTQWGINALKNLGCNNVIFSTELNNYDIIKKHSAIEMLLGMYVDLITVKTLKPYEDLMNFYTSDLCVAYFFKSDDDSVKMLDFIKNHSKKDQKLSYSDVGVMLRLLQLRNRNIVIEGALNYLDHAIADEGQDFALHELEAIYAALNKRKSLTLCADENQRILSFVDPDGLRIFKEKLNVIGLNKNTFTVGYRSAPEIMKIANIVLSKEKEKLIFDKKSKVVSVMTCHNKEDAALEIGTKLHEYQVNDPSSLTAIICKTKADVRYVHEVLSKYISEKEGFITNLFPAGTISYSPGVIVINAHQVKGLEFTNVILWNPSYKAYRNNVEDKHLLYVATSRACKKLSIAHFEKLSSWFKTDI